MNTDDQKLKNIAQKVLDKVEINENGKYGSVIAILMVISIILTVIRVLQECNKNKLKSFSGKDRYEYFGAQIKNTAIKRSWFTKMMIKKAIRKELPREQYKEYGIALMNAILTTGENLTEDEVITLSEATNV